MMGQNNNKEEKVVTGGSKKKIVRQNKKTLFDNLHVEGDGHVEDNSTRKAGRNNNYVLCIVIH